MRKATRIVASSFGIIAGIAGLEHGNSLLGLPIPLAISPVLYFAAASVLLRSWPLALATALLGVAHIPISYRDYRRIVAPTPAENETSWHESSDRTYFPDILA